MNRRVLAYTGAAFGLIALWFFIIYAPYHKQREQEFANTKQALNQLSDFDQIFSNLPNYLSMSKDLEASKMDLISHLYAKSDILELFKNLEKTAQKRNLTTQEIRPSIQELLQLNTLILTTEQPLFVNIDMHLTGNYVDIGRFVQTLENTTFFRGINHSRIIENNDASEGDLRLEIGFTAMLGRLEAES